MDKNSKKPVPDSTLTSNATFILSNDGDEASVVSSSSSVFTTPSQPNQVKVLQGPRPFDRFPSNFDSLDSKIYESTFAPIAFRTHLALLKNEGQALRKLTESLQDSVEPERTRSEIHSGNASSIQDKGSKTNFMTNSCLCLASFPKEPPDLDPAKRITIDDIIFNSPRMKQPGLHLVCLNATLPVLSLSDSDGVFVLNTIIECSHDALKTIRLEVLCDAKVAGGFVNSLKHPYLKNMEPGSVILIRNFNLTESVVGVTAKRYLCIQARHPTSVEFYPKKAFQSIILFDTEEELLKSTRDFEQLYSSRGDAGKRVGSLWTTLATEAKHAAEEWQQWGNECSVQRLHTQAYFAYSTAMRFEPESLDLAGARSAALISLGLYNAAMKDVDYISSKDPFNTGYILRKVNCYWGVGRLEDAVEYLKTLLSRLLLAAAQRAKEKSRSRDEEREACDLRRKSMFLQRILTKTEDMIVQRDSVELLGSEKYFRSSAKVFYDEPEYYNPVAVKYEYPDKPNSRKIVITRHDVKAGNLLVVTKALSVVFINETNKHYMNPNDELMNLTIQKIMLDKPTKSSIYRFSCTEESGGAGSDCLDSHRSLEFSKEDVKRLCESCFYSCSTIQEGTSIIPGSGIGQTTAIGIWPFLRNIRHTCVGGNAVWYTRGNFLFVRAIREIHRGEEITMAHVEPTEPIWKREKFLEQRGMDCNCPLCLFEKTEPENVKIKRAALLNEMRFVSTLTSAEWSKDFTEGKLKRLQLCLEDLILLRSAYARLNFPIVEPLLNYGVHMIAMSRYDEAIVAFEKAFFVVDNTTAIYMQILLSLRLSYCHLKKKNKDKVRAKKWFSTMNTYAALLYGCIDPVKYHFKMEIDYLESKGLVAPAKPTPPPRNDDLLI